MKKSIVVTVVHNSMTRTRLPSLYRHTQPGTLVLVATAAPSLLCVYFAIATRGSPVPLALIGLFALIGFTFHSLTVDVTNERLHWWFGPGWISKSVAIAEIESAQAVTNRWYYGWGIRYTPRGWLYNVSGWEAVEIRMENGRVFRIGTDEPKRLATAIEQARGS